MGLDRILRKTEIRGDLSVGLSRQQQAENVLFASRELSIGSRFLPVRIDCAAVRLAERQEGRNDRDAADGRAL